MKRLILIDILWSCFGWQFVFEEFYEDNIKMYHEFIDIDLKQIGQYFQNIGDDRKVWAL